MSAAAALPVTVEVAPEEARRTTTLFEVLQVLEEITDDENELVATVLWMLESGSIRLSGNVPALPPVEELH